jgi:hypothetical protein
MCQKIKQIPGKKQALILFFGLMCNKSTFKTHIGFVIEIL